MGERRVWEGEAGVVEFFGILGSSTAVDEGPGARGALGQEDSGPEGPYYLRLFPEPEGSGSLRI